MTRKEFDSLVPGQYVRQHASFRNERLWTVAEVSDTSTLKNHRWPHEGRIVKLSLTGQPHALETWIGPDRAPAFEAELFLY